MAVAAYHLPAYPALIGSTAMGSTRFSPVLDTIKKIHISAAEKIASGV